MKASFFLISLVALICGCSSSDNHFKPLSILEGEWKYNQDGTKGIEKWALKNDSLMSGTNMVDSKVQEELKIFSRNGQIIYSPTLNGVAYEFTLSKGELNDFKFVNDSHDFPKFIRYKFITIDSMDVSIGDTKNETHWQYSRVKK